MATKTRKTVDPAAFRASPRASTARRVARSRNSSGYFRGADMN
jgi:hypothetical protein